MKCPHARSRTARRHWHWRQSLVPHSWGGIAARVCPQVRLALRALALAAAAATAAGEVTSLIPKCIITGPPNGTFLGGPLVELEVATPAEARAPTGSDGADAVVPWTLCARGSSIANTSCIVCGLPDVDVAQEEAAGSAQGSDGRCVISVTVPAAGKIAPEVWAGVGAFGTMQELSLMVSQPPCAAASLSILAMTPREVLALSPATGVRAAPPSTSQAWWGRSTQQAIEAAVEAGQRVAARLPAAHASSTVPGLPEAVPPPPPLSLRAHTGFLGPHTAAAAAAAAAPSRGPPLALPVLVAVAAGARGASVVNDTLSALHGRLSSGRGIDIVLFAYDDTDWVSVAAGCAASAGSRVSGCNGTAASSASSGSIVGNSDSVDQVTNDTASQDDGNSSTTTTSSSSWADDVTIVRRRGHMKWWFAKRFLHPALVSDNAYSWVLVLDEDAALEGSFDAEAFLGTLERHGALMGQPAHADGSETSFPFLQAKTAQAVAEAEGTQWHGANTLDGEAVVLGAAGDAADAEQAVSEGRAEVLWTTMAECGPAVAFRAADVWPCVWGLLESDLTSGFGYDLVWGTACAAGAEASGAEAEVDAGEEKEAVGGGVQPPVRAAVTLEHALRHVDLGTASGASVGFFRRAVAEGLVLFERRRLRAAATALGGGSSGEGPDGVVPMSHDWGMAAMRGAIEAGLGTFPSEPQVLGVGRAA